MVNTSNIKDANLRKILDSASIGVLKTKGEGGVTRSSLFEGISLRRNKSDPNVQIEMKQAKMNFAESLIKEFKLSLQDQDSIKDKLSKSSNPLSLRDAKLIIKAYAWGHEMNKHIEASPLNAHTFMDKELRQTLGDPRFFSRSIERAVRQDLTLQLNSLVSKGGKAQDIFDHAKKWCETEGRDTAVGAVNQLIRELGFKTVIDEKRDALGVELLKKKEEGANMTQLRERAHEWSKENGLDTGEDAVTSLLSRFGLKTKRDEAVTEMKEKMKDVQSEYYTVRNNKEAMSELREHAINLIKKYDLDPSEEGIRSLMRDGQVPL